VILCGCLFGLAAASRSELCLFAPALLVVASVRPAPDGHITFRLPARALTLVLIAAGFFIANIKIMQSITARLEVVTNVEPIGMSTGASSLLRILDYPRSLNKVVIGQSFAPLGLLAVVSLLPLLIRGPAGERNRGRVAYCFFLIGVGWTIWLGWLFQAPIAHLRYLWPSLACFAFVAGQALAHLYQKSLEDNQTYRCLSILAISAALIVGGSLSTFRSVVMGENNYLSWEWSREMAADYFRRFQHLRDQRDAMEYLRQVPNEETIVCLGRAFTLRYLTHRPIYSIEEYIEQSASARGLAHLVIPPAIGTYLCLSPQGFEWIERNCELEAQFGRYSVYVMPPQLPSEPQILVPARTNYWGHPQSISWSDWDTIWKKPAD
jgi:hypothetical protein